MSDARRIASVGGRRTAYREAGPDAGEPILFVHGVGLNADVWAPQMAAFGAVRRTIAYDMWGHGGSDLPPENAVLADYVGQLHGLLEALGIEQATVVGHSMGALVAIGFALAHPRRVCRMVALNAVYDRAPESRAAALSRADALEGEGGATTTDQALARWFGVESHSAEREQVRRWLESVDPKGYARAYRVFATSDDAFVGRLADLAVPALFATGEYDPHSTPEMSRRMAMQAPHGSVQVLAGERHMAAFASPAVVNDMLAEFLRDDHAGAGEPARAAVGNAGAGG
jgi:pimeloyl-ACP methyl ester carboxylesterase